MLVQKRKQNKKLRKQRGSKLRCNEDGDFCPSPTGLVAILGNINGCPFPWRLSSVSVAENAGNRGKFMSWKWWVFKTFFYHSLKKKKNSNDNNEREREQVSKLRKTPEQLLYYEWKYEGNMKAVRKKVEILWDWKCEILELEQWSNLKNSINIKKQVKCLWLAYWLMEAKRISVTGNLRQKERGINIKFRKIMKIKMYEN